MSSVPRKNLPEDTHKSFWMPRNYHRTVQRTDDFFHACNQIVACYQERARVERQYAQQLNEWNAKWRPLVDASPLYGSLLQAWQSFLCSAERLSALHSSICRSLVSDDGDRVKTWQKDSFHRSFFCGFTESQDFDTGFSSAQKPWVKKLKKLEKARRNFHKACRKEQVARELDSYVQGNPDVSLEKQRKIQDDRELACKYTHKMRAQYEKVLEEVSRYTPRYMEEMESVFDQSQEEERKRISFLKQTFLSIHRHLDITNNENVKAVYNDLHRTLMSISEQDDLQWWRNNKGPGMPMEWPFLEEWRPEEKSAIGKGTEEENSTPERSDMIGGIRVRALYDYEGQEADELSFKAGEELLKIEDEDDQGWCRGMKDNGREGMYPANYVEIVL